jgi:microcystin-dependent protein
MAQPYVGEVRMFGGNFAPVGWMFCAGQLLAIAEYETLFNLIGTTYGGDGQSTFGLPDLRGRIPIHQGSGYVVGQTGGVEQVTLTVNQMPNHTHPAQAQAGPGNQATPAGGIWAASAWNQYAAYSGANPVTMNPNAVQPAGGNQPHDNLMPYLAVSFIISLFGIFPSQA